MKLIILMSLVACSYGEKLNRVYLPPNHAPTSGGSSEFLQTPIVSSSSNFNGLTGEGNEYTDATKANDYANGGTRSVDDDHHHINAFGNYERPERPRAALERNAAILRQTNQIDGEAYSYAFETENGIVAEENGVATNGVEAQGGYSYTGDDGQVYSIRYTAGQNGFVLEGDHLPTPHPIPEEILSALEKNARDEAAGIFDDGSYNEEKYASSDTGYQSPDFGHNGVYSEVINDSNDDSVVINSAFNREVFRASGFNNGVSRMAQLGNGVAKEYLPPTGQRSSGNSAASGYGSIKRKSSFNARTGYNY